jgi:polyvinyl alcohol dehydrogenase (cytochrome)
MILGRLSMRLKILGLVLLLPMVAFAAEPANDPALLTGATGNDPKGEAIYKEHCASCHDNPEGRIPPRSTLAIMRTPEEVVRSLTTGMMQQQGMPLNQDDKRRVAMWVTGKPFGRAVDVDPNANRCKKPGTLTIDDKGWNGWGGPGVTHARFQAQPGLNVEHIPRLKVKWAFAYPGMGAFGQPMVLGDYLFVTTLSGWVFALNAETGCTYWAFDAGAQVRSGIMVATLPASNPAREVAYFQTELGRVLALDARSGKIVWETTIEDHPMARMPATPLFHEGRLYITISSLEEVTAADPKYPCCSARGGLVALDASTGKQIWKSYAIQQEPKPTKISTAGTQMTGPAGAAIFNTPTIDGKRRLIYASTGDNYTDVYADATNAIVAFDLDTGARRWVMQGIKHDAWILGCDGTAVNNCPSPLGPDWDFGTAPMLLSMESDKQILIGAAKSGEVFGMDPDANGKVLWKNKIARGGAQGGIMWGGAFDGEKLYFAISDFEATRPKDAGGLFALDPLTGNEVWRMPTPVSTCIMETLYCSPAQLAAVTAIPGAVFAGSLDGRLRAYSAKDGAILWAFDTLLPIKAVNGATAHGGSIDSGGATVVNGRVYVNSGSTRLNGNALFAFSVDGK